MKNKANIFLGLISLVVSLALVEILLRFTDFRLLLEVENIPRYYYQADSEKGFDITPNVAPFVTKADYYVKYEMWSNELGCFDRPYFGEKDYILVVGDSFSHAFAPFENKWTVHLENLLGIRVIKAGVSSYGTKQALLKAKGIIAKIKTPPKLIIVGYFFNDFEDDYLFPARTVMDGYLVPTKKIVNKATGECIQRDAAYLKKKIEAWQQYGTANQEFLAKITNFVGQRSVAANLTVKFLRNFYDRYIGHGYWDTSILLASLPYPWVAEAWESHMKNLAAFGDLAAETGSSLLVIIIPLKEQVHPFLVDWQGIDPAGQNKKVHAALQRENICYLDLLEQFKVYRDPTPKRVLSKYDDLYWRNDAHWSFKGEMLTGYLVADYILKANLIKLSERESKISLIRQTLDNIKR